MNTTERAEKAAFSIDETVIYIGICRANIYRLLRSNAISSFRIGKRRLILRSELDRFIAEHAAGISEEETLSRSRVG